MATKFAHYMTLGNKLCEALGLDPMVTTSITIDCGIGDRLPSVTVGMLITDEASGDLIDVIKRYDLVEPLEED
jgi:hypothetical protein